MAKEGPGKYDDICTKVMVETDADIVLCAIFNGIKGTGFSVTSLRPDVREILPKILRSIADDLEGVS